MKTIDAPVPVGWLFFIVSVLTFALPYVACANGLNKNCGNGKRDTLSHLVRGGFTQRAYTVTTVLLALCLYTVQ